MIRLRFSTTSSLVPSALIRWRTGCAQSHIEFINDEGYTLGARWSLSERDNGVWLRPPISTKGQIRVVHATFEGIEKAWAQGMKLQGTRYNLEGIFGILFARNLTDPERLDCSNFVLKAAEMAGIELLKDNVIAPWKITPRDILLSEKLSLLPQIQ